MGTIWHFIINAVIALALTAATFLSVNVALHVCGRGNPRMLKTWLTVRKRLQGLPAGATLECRGRIVSVLTYDRRNDRDATLPFYTASRFSPLTWSGSPLSAKSVHSRAGAEIAIAVGALIIAFLGLPAVGVLLAISVSWLWWFAVIVLAAIEVTETLTSRIFWLKLGAFTGLVPVIILHRYHLYPLPVAYGISSGVLIIILAFWGWMDRSHTFQD